MGGQSNVYAYKVNDLFLSTLHVFKGWVGGQKKKNSVFVVIECPLREISLEKFEYST